jgi:hypothetical protein
LGFYLLAFACEALVFTLWLKTKASQAKAQKGKNQKVKTKASLAKAVGARTVPSF